MSDSATGPPAPRTTVRATGVEPGVETFGREDDPLVLLAGGTTMLSWPGSLRAARGRRPAGGRLRPARLRSAGDARPGGASVRAARSGRRRGGAGRRARRAQAEQAAASRSPAATVLRPAAGPSDLQADRAHTPSPGQPSQPHLALRIDARPPWSHPLTRLYWCPRCQYLTGGQLQSSPVAHEIPGPDQWMTWADLHPGDSI